LGILDNLEPPRRQTPCRVRTVLGELDKADVAKLTAAIADVDSWPAYTLYKSLHKLGIRISADAITRHRTEVCSCLKN
jgi:hypothetical protein